MKRTVYDICGSGTHDTHNEAKGPRVGDVESKDFQGEMKQSLAVN